jgi:Na+-driven multidrug efflux pump
MKSGKSVYVKVLTFLKNTVGVAGERIVFALSYFVGFGLGALILAFNKKNRKSQTKNKSNWTKPLKSLDLSRMY